MNLGQRAAISGVIVTFLFGVFVCPPKQACVAGAIIAVAVLIVGEDKDSE